MIHQVRLVFLIAAALAQPASAQLRLVWADEFDGFALDDTSWEPMIGNGHAYGIPGWGNNELEYYTDRASNVFVLNGMLHIVAKQESYEGYDYTSARLRSKGRRDFRYGRFEARIRIPTGQGIWPAFWMLPTDSPWGGWAASGEIDIFETINVPTSVHGTIHHGGQWPANASNGGSFSPGGLLSDDFHVYAIEWEPDEIRWYFDDTLYHTATSDDWWSANAPEDPNAPFDQDFHFLLNIAVGGNWPGPPDASTSFPQEMLVDYVRVYTFEQGPFGEEPHLVPGRIEAEDFDSGLPGEAWVDCDEANQGGAYRESGVDIEPCDEGGFNIGWICPAEWLEYTIEVPVGGTYRFDARIASLATGGAFWMTLDGEELTGPMTVPSTGGWQAWQTISTEVEIEPGSHVLRFTNLSGTQSEYNLQWFEFTPVGCSPADFAEPFGALDIFDVFGFLDAFEARNPAADLAPDVGVFDVFDVLEFLEFFSNGC